MNDSKALLDQLRIDRNATPEPQAGRRRYPLIAASAVVALTLVSAGVLAMREDAQSVATATVEAPPSAGVAGGSAVSVLDATGYVVARRQATVSAKITGKVREVLIEEGSRVEAGQIMATLDPVDADAQRTLAQSQLDAARSQVEGVRAQLKEAEANAARLGQLVGQKLVSRSQYDQTVAARDSLRAQLATAQRNAQVATDSLRIADNGVDNTVVRAPFAGVVIAKAAQPGEIVSPLSAGGGFTRTGIGTIVDMDSLEVEVDVGEAFIGRVQPKMPVEATLNAYQDWKIPAEVIAIIPTADRGKATVKVRIALKVRDPRIVPDMGVRVSFLEAARPEPAAKRPAGVRVPQTALVVAGDRAHAFVVAGDGDELIAKRRPVTLGRLYADQREVLSGLSAGERVVLSPPATLTDGARVAPGASADTDPSSD